MRFLFSLAVLSGLIYAPAKAELPTHRGYTQTALPHAVPLPVTVIGVGVSEQDVPVLLYVPGEGAAPIDGARAASPIPGLPATVGGFRLVVLPEPLQAPLLLRNGHVRDAAIPLFAYQPAGDRVDLPALRSFLDPTPTPKRVPTAVAFVPPPGPVAVVTSRALPPTQPTVLAPTMVPSSPAVTPAVASIGLASPLVPESASPPAAVISSSPVLVAETAPDPATTTKVPTTWDEALASDASFSNRMTIGELIVDERQQLRSRMPVHGEFPGRPLAEVLLCLATESGIDFSIGSIPSESTVWTRFTAAPFAAMEQIARQFGVGLYHDKDDPLWVIRRIDPETLILRTYKLEHITLGESAGASGDKTFGSGFSDQNGRSRSGMGSSGMGGGSMGMSGSSMGMSGGSGGGNLGATNGIVLPHQADTFTERFSQPSDVLFTIRSILGLTEQAPMVSDIAAATGEQDPNAPRVSTRPSGQQGDKVNGLVSYNADTTTLLVVGTERQQAWVAEYLKLVDRPVVTVAVDAMFVESSDHPTSKIGADWSKTAGGWKLKSGAMNFGSLQHPTLPSGTLLDGDGLETTISAYVSETKSRVARYPRVVTHNNREVRIATTSNIPVLSNAATVAGTSGYNDGGGTAVGTIQTNYTAGTQQVGTIITLLPTKVGADKVHLKITIEISSGDSGSSGSTGEQLTGRIATNSTTYEGEVEVPAGRTLAIGGLERIADENGIGRVPWLSKVPVFGFLFRKKDADFSHTNITLFITPRFIEGAALPASDVRADGSASRALGQSADLERMADAPTVRAKLSQK